MKGLSQFLVAMILLAAMGAQAQSTNSLSDAEIQGRALAEKILQQWPTQNVTNTGVLQIRDENGKRVEVPVVIKTLVAPSSWQASYMTWSNRLYTEAVIVTHYIDQPNQYVAENINPPPTDTNGFIPLTGDRLTEGFAHSTFSIADLGLEFFHWPGQKVLRREVHRSCGCTVLQSTNPDPSTNGYSRVVSWIDNDSLGIVEAYAYDARGKLLKDFEPKDLKKVNGQYQVQTMVMENVQTGARTRMEFNLKSK